MLYATELNSVSLRFQITEYRKELSRLDKKILSNKEKNIDNKKNYKDLEIIKDEIPRMLIRLKKVERIEQFRKNERWYYKFLDTAYGAHYMAALYSIKDNLIFGTGLRSFRTECKKYDFINSLNVDLRCSTHPHNLHLEILSEVGLTGYILLLISIFLIILKFKKKNVSINLNIYLLCIFLTLIFPFKPSGAFFSSWAGFIFWYSFAVLNFAVSSKNKKFVS